MEQNKEAFNAKWIWDGGQQHQGQWMNFRKIFTLNHIPSKVEVKIAADSKYWLWINGKMDNLKGCNKYG